MKIKNVIRFAFFSLIMGAALSLSSTVQAQEKVNSQVDEMPIPPGGITGLTNYMIQNLTYPSAAKEANVQGMVVVSFIVTAEGKVEGVEVLRGIGSGCDQEAVRVISQSGTWTPAKKEGKAVSTKITLPVQFKL
ncbi:MAG: energy transducer TonB [Algoriphagus sp.]|uniref:energy transducer TonB n=1 Tax=Algoriphagus sp. TaxID=1872435 RepID=UPI00276EDFFD|nr:energy transducer TonB [Algoriphagus sp.]